MLIEEKKTKANDTRCSQAVTHPSTDRAQRCLTSVIGRELVFFNVVWLLAEITSFPFRTYLVPTKSILYPILSQFHNFLPFLAHSKNPLFHTKN